MVVHAVVLAGLIGLPPLAAGNKDVERLYLQIASLQSDVSQLRRSNDDVLKEMRRLNEVLAEQSALLKKGVQDAQRQTEATQLALREITDAVATLRDRLQSIVPAAPVQTATLPDTSAASSPASATLAAGTNAAAGSVPVPPAAGELYTQAYADYARGNYDLAIQAFQEYIKHYPTAHLADNAQYWIGECLFGKRQYAEAVSAWDELLRQYPGTDKIPDARYKKAMALERLGRRSQALLEYRYVFEHFPNSEAGRRAREKVQAQ
jgi:tol-pal system protein YbgF